jgi:hypothetical protein
MNIHRYYLRLSGFFTFFQDGAKKTLIGSSSLSPTERLMLVYRLAEFQLKHRRNALGVSCHHGVKVPNQGKGSGDV